MLWERVAKIRALDRPGLLKLAAAQIHEKSWDEAAAALRTLRSKGPPRFGDVPQQARELERKMEGQEKR